MRIGLIFPQLVGVSDATRATTGENVLTSTGRHWGFRMSFVKQDTDVLQHTFAVALVSKQGSIVESDSVMI